MNEDQLRDLHAVIDTLQKDASSESMGKYFILIDKLDERWVDDAVRFNLIRSLIESLKTFRKIENLKILVALRTDVIERVVQETQNIGFQREKFDEYFVNLIWSKALLKKLIDKRIAFLFKKQYFSKGTLKFDDVFRNNIGTVNAFDYMCDRTLLRPRDLITFVNLCLAKSEGQYHVTASCIRTTEREFSRLRLNALENEWQSAFPTLHHLFSLFDQRKLSYELSEVCGNDKIKPLSQNITQLKNVHNDPMYELAFKVLRGSISAEEFVIKSVTILYRVCAIGIKLQPNESYIYANINQPIIDVREIDIQCKIRFHPMLCSALGIHAGS